MMRNEILISMIVFLIGMVLSTSIYSELSYANTVDLPETGQKICYDSTGNVISCVGTGQDGDIRAGVVWPDPRFSDNGDGTVVDHLTGLMWLKSGNCFQTKNWVEALGSVADLNANPGKYSCGGYTATYGDWVLPNIHELESLANPGETDSAVWLNSQGFKDVKSSNYWSSTNGEDVAWGMEMPNGHTHYQKKSITYYPWPVRRLSTPPAQVWQTGQKVSYAAGDDGDLERGAHWPEPRFSNNGDGTVKDNLTGLIWLLDANCFGTKTWQEALDAVSGLNSNPSNYTCSGYTGTYGDWRLPNRKELQTLADFSQDHPSLPLEHPFVNLGSDPYYWSSSTHPTDHNWATILYVRTGKLDDNIKSTHYYVWPVRDGSVEPPQVSKDIIINIKGENDEKLNGKLYVKLPPPSLSSVLDPKTYFYPYFSDLSYAFIFEPATLIGYVLKSFNVSNGRLTLDITDLEDFKRNDSFFWEKTEHLNLDETRYLFFYPTDPGYENSVTWWTLHYRAIDYNSKIKIPIIQNVRVLKDSDWSENLSLDGQKCYSPNHRDLRNYVLEAPYNANSGNQDKIYDGIKEPTLIVHGINGQSGYWEDNVSNLRKKESTENTWVFNYRGTETIVACSELFRSAIKDVGRFYPGRKFNVATHSYGGVIVRKYCIDHADEASINIGKIIMFGPPHHGSYSAQRIYEDDTFAVAQRLWTHLDPHAPIYEELTPGSPNLLEMVGKEFPSEIAARVVAGTKTYIWAGVAHNEAPNHDDGVVSISSASLLPLNTEGLRVPLWLMYIDHDEMRYDSRVAELISKFVGNEPTPVGKDALISMEIEDEFPRETGYTYHDTYHVVYSESGVDLSRGGLIVDCRDSGYGNITRIETSLEYCGNFGINPESLFWYDLFKHPDYAVFTFRDRDFSYSSPNCNWGIAYRLNGLNEKAFLEDVTLKFFSGETLVAERVVQIYPCATTVFRLSKGQSPYYSLSDNPVYKNIRFNSETNCEVTAEKSITIDSGTRIQNGAKVILKAPKVNVKSGAIIENGCFLKIKQ